jgi:hypothetical protein
LAGIAVGAVRLCGQRVRETESERQRESVEAGGWPGGDVGMLSDYLEMAQRHPCDAPIDWSTI